MLNIKRGRNVPKDSPDTETVDKYLFRFLRTKAFQKEQYTISFIGRR